MFSILKLIFYPLFCLIIKYRKKGTPIKDVIIPTGNSVGAIIFLAIVSEINNSNAPIKDDAGIKYL